MTAVAPPVARPPEAVQGAVLEALAYADVFDWPLTETEIHRYLPAPASMAQVEVAIARLQANGAVEREGDLVTLAGRLGLASIRPRRVRNSEAMWPVALRWSRIVSRLPFVRMVAVSGSLAVQAARDHDDLDLFLVTADGRLWLTRAMTMLVVRVARLTGLRLCPNYLLAESALELSDRSLFTARELVQMVPVTGARVYARLIAANLWYRGFLPNAEPLATAEPGRGRSRLRGLAEAVLRSGPFDRFERWEMRRKSRQLCAVSNSSEIRYDATCCKGHADEHGRRVLAAFEARLALLSEVI